MVTQLSMFTFIDHEPEDRFYNFVSQSVFAVMTNVDHIGITNDGRLFTVCEQTHQIHIYDKKCFVSSSDNNINLIKSVPCYNVDIQKIIHGTSSNGREYFGVIILPNKNSNLNNEENNSFEFNNSSSVRIYTNFTDPLNETRVANIELNDVFRYDEDCFNNNHQNADQFENANIIEFQYLNQLPFNTNAIDISSCGLTGNFAILLDIQLIIIYKLEECDISIKNQIINTIDFNLAKIVEISWQPSQIGLLYNYLSLMSMEHISLIHLSINKDGQWYPTVQMQQNHSSTLNDSINFKEIIYPGLFNTISRGKHTIYGPVEKIGCNFMVKNEQNMNEKYELIFCHELNSLNVWPDESYCLIDNNNMFNKNSENRKINLIMSSIDIHSKSQKYQQFHFQFLSTNDSLNEDKKLMAIVLTILYNNEITMYAIDLRKDYLHLLPVSKLIIQPGFFIKNISVNIENGLLHLVNGEYIETYVTHINQFLATDCSEQCAYKLKPKTMFKISSHIFFNIIHLFSSNNYMYLVGQEIINQCTFYRLTRPSIEQLKMDILVKIKELNEQFEPNNLNSSAIMNKKILQMNYYIYALTKFLIQYLNFNNININFNFINEIDKKTFEQLQPSQKQLLYLMKLNSKIHRFIKSNYREQEFF